MIYKVNEDGTISNSHGFPKSWRTIWPKKQYVRRLEAAQEKELDEWFKSMQECVEKESEDQFRFRYSTISLTPLDVQKYMK